MSRVQAQWDDTQHKWVIIIPDVIDTTSSNVIGDDILHTLADGSSVVARPDGLHIVLDHNGQTVEHFGARPFNIKVGDDGLWHKSDERPVFMHQTRSGVDTIWPDGTTVNETIRGRHCTRTLMTAEGVETFVPFLMLFTASGPQMFEVWPHVVMSHDVQYAHRDSDGAWVIDRQLPHDVVLP